MINILSSSLPERNKNRYSQSKKEPLASTNDSFPQKRYYTGILKIIFLIYHQAVNYRLAYLTKDYGMGLTIINIRKYLSGRLIWLILLQISIHY